MKEKAPSGLAAKVGESASYNSHTDQCSECGDEIHTHQHVARERRRYRLCASCTAIAWRNLRRRLSLH